MILFMGGGGELKTKVIAVLNEDSLPASEWDGTLALITPLDIGSVYVDLNVPDAPNVGDVHIRPNLNAQRVYTIGNVVVPFADVYVYDGAAWGKVTYFQYDGAEWKPGRLYLLDGSADTGIEWNTPMFSTVSCSVTATEDGYALKGSNGGNMPAGLQTASKIDLTGFSAVHFTGYNPSAAGAINHPIRGGIQNQAAVSNQDYEGMKPLTAMVAFAATTAAGEFDLSVDTSEYDGLYYVGISGAYEPFYVYQIWLEV